MSVYTYISRLVWSNRTDKIIIHIVFEQRIANIYRTHNICEQMIFPYNANYEVKQQFNKHGCFVLSVKTQRYETGPA